MSKSLINMVNTTSTTLSSGNVIPLGYTNRRFGCNLKPNGNAIREEGEGYYKILGTFTFTPSASDTYTIQIYKDGVPLAGANASILAAAITTLNVQGEDKVRCCDGGSNITFEITAGTTSHTVVLSNANVIVEKS